MAWDDKIDWLRLNYDEEKVPPFELPDPLVFQNGAPVKTKSDWVIRRAELLDLFGHFVYGKTPQEKVKINSDILSESLCFNGGATMREVALTVTRDSRVTFHLLLLTPNHVDRPVPLFLGLNFEGNHTIIDSPDIRLPKIWTNEWDVTHPVLAEATKRGCCYENWMPDKIIESGFALATIYYQEIAVDVDDGCTNGIQSLFLPMSQKKRPVDGWGKIGAWAWGLSRAIDFLQTEPRIDPAKLILIGHSRLGKTALWAAAQDERVTMVIANNSGCGGAALGRRFFGEFPAFLSEIRPHWFAPNYEQLSPNIEQIPVDQHELIALIAPRPVYFASASEDAPADPLGEFLAAKNAVAVYEFLGKGKQPLGVALPSPNRSIGDTIGYHLRSGKHDITRFDWEQFLLFAQKHFQ